MTSRSGLSLFELLVALALLTLIATGLAGALGLAVNVWDRSAASETTTEEVALRSRLRMWLRSAVPPSRLTSFPSEFTGGPDRFSFVTLSETPFLPDAAAMRVTVSVSGTSLIVTVQMIDDDGAEISQIDGVLAEGVSPNFSYYSDAIGPPSWRDTWDDTARLPVLLRIEAPEGSTPDWPEFVVRLLLE